MNITIYSSESTLKYPLKLVKDMLKDLWDSRELAWRLAVRDISSQYRQTFLGYIWALIPIIVITLSFSLMKNHKVVELSSGSIPYVPFIFVGTIIWQTFAESVRQPIKILSANKTVISRLQFPREAMVLSGILQVLFSLMIKILLGIVALPIMQADVSFYGLIEMLGFLVMLILVGTTFGIILAPLGLLYNDIQNGIGFILLYWMFLTPVLYIPEQKGFIASINNFNPVSGLLISAREALFGQNFTMINQAMIVCGLTLLLLFAGWFLFRLFIPIVLERVGA